MIGDCPNVRKEEKMFELSLGGPQYPLTVRLPIKIPCNDDPVELAHRVVQHHNLPIYMHQELSEELSKFISSATCKLSRQRAADRLQELAAGRLQTDSIAQYWQQQDQEQQVCPELLSEEELPSLYHSLVHSPCGGKLLQLEHQYSREVAMLVRRRDLCIQELDDKQAAELTAAVSRRCSDSHVNAVTTSHLEAAELACAEWDSAISGLKEQQIRNFRAMLRDGQVAGASQDVSSVLESGPVLEESFTIQLGTQMKQMHNLRLVAADAMELCHYCDADESSLPPQRIQTSLQLYGRNLHGLVIMVDNRVNSYSGTKKEFGSVCSRATELHFPELCDQLERTRELLVPAVGRWRSRRAAAASNKTQNRSNSGGSGQEARGQSDGATHQLMPGDVYITRHSNLSAVHVVFHVVCDDSVRSNNLNSRDPVILGLRNVLKVACLCDITTLSLPLLLSNSLSEDMSVQWCQKRAELIYKCVKGFMMEMTSWGGSEMNTLQFMLPKNISEVQFQSLSAMLPSIFRVSNPLVVTE